jgi:hypothetical protein
MEKLRSQGNQDRDLDCRRSPPEAAAAATIGHGAVILDEVLKKGHQGGNYPTYDIASATELASVKTHWTGQGEPVIKDYIEDFSHMMSDLGGRGFQKGLSPVEQDAHNILNARDRGVSVPEALKGADCEGAVHYIRHRTVLRIPDDHVSSVREMLRQEARRSPSWFNLPSDPSDAQVEALLSRIQPIGVSARDLQAMIDAIRDAA